MQANLSSLIVEIEFNIIHNYLTETIVIELWSGDQYSKLIKANLCNIIEFVDSL